MVVLSKKGEEQVLRIPSGANGAEFYQKVGADGRIRTAPMGFSVGKHDWNLNALPIDFAKGLDKRELAHLIAQARVIEGISRDEINEETTRAGLSEITETSVYKNHVPIGKAAMVIAMAFTAAALSGCTVYGTAEVFGHTFYNNTWNESAHVSPTPVVPHCPNGRVVNSTEQIQGDLSNDIGVFEINTPLRNDSCETIRCAGFAGGIFFGSGNVGYGSCWPVDENGSAIRSEQLIVVIEKDENGTSYHIVPQR